MIVREIVDNPELIDSFDFFNDTKDTLTWLLLKGHVDLANKLKSADEYHWRIINSSIIFQKQFDKRNGHDILRIRS